MCVRVEEGISGYKSAWWYHHYCCRGGWVGNGQNFETGEITRVQQRLCLLLGNWNTKPLVTTRIFFGSDENFAATWLLILYFYFNFMQERFCLHHGQNPKLHTLPLPLQWRRCHHAILNIKLCAKSSWCSQCGPIPLKTHQTVNSLVSRLHRVRRASNFCMNFLCPVGTTEFMRVRVLL